MVRLKKTNKIISTFLLLILFQGCSDNKTCTAFHTGTFELIDDSFDLHNLIERSDTLQVEINQKTGVKTVGKIEWINDCEYVFTYLESSNELMKHFIGRQLTVEIFKIEGNTIYFKSSLDGFDMVDSYQMTKID